MQSLSQFSFDTHLQPERQCEIDMCVYQQWQVDEAPKFYTAE